jgi:hypothetical protein
VRHQYAPSPEELEIRFYAAAMAEGEAAPLCFERIAWVLPKELGEYDFLAANRELIANLATGRIKAGEILNATGKGFNKEGTEDTEAGKRNRGPRRKL